MEGVPLVRLRKVNYLDYLGCSDCLDCLDCLDYSAGIGAGAIGGVYSEPRYPAVTAGAGGCSVLEPRGPHGEHIGSHGVQAGAAQGEHAPEPSVGV